MLIIDNVRRYVVESCQGKRVLYVGAGNEQGNLSESVSSISKVCKSIVGIDRDPAVVERNPAVSLVLADLNKPIPPLQVGPVDLVVMTEVLEHLDAPAIALQELSKIAPGADFLGSVPNGLSLGRIVMALCMPKLYATQDGTHTMLFNTNTLKNMLQAAGMKEVRLVPYEERALGRLVVRLRPEFACGYVIRAKLSDAVVKTA